MNLKKYFLFQVNVKFANKIYKTVISLTSRADMKYPMLIGRKLLKNRFLVDVSKEFIKQEKKMLVYILSRNEGELYSTKRLYEEANNKGWK